MGTKFITQIETGRYPDKNTLYDLFITQNLSRDQICKLYNFSSAVFKKLTSFYNIKKSFNLIKENMDETSLLKYGVECSKVDKTDKLKQTCLQRYGVDNVMKQEGFKLKQQKSLEAHYGVTAPILNQDIKHKIQNTCEVKYGYPSYRTSLLNTDTYQILSNKNKFEEYLQLLNKRVTFKDVAEKLNCSIGVVIKYAHLYNLLSYIQLSANTSSYEQEICDLLKEWGILFERSNRTVLEGLEIDIYCPDYKIGIEFNGDYYHSNLCQTDKKYHFNKSLKASQKGIRLIHIYEYEWNLIKDKIISLLKIAFNCYDEKIYARNCIVKQITNKEAMVLNNKVHLQGHRDAQVTYGLYYKDQLVQLMSFSHTKYNRNIKTDNDWEIIRGCPGSNNIVIGGVSRLFSHFVKDYKPSKVFSYCDFNKFDGRSYEALGMKFIGYTGPDKTWLIDGQGVKRNPSRYKEYKERAEGVIWGAGSKKYEINFDE